jgi:Winged helix DNA-binding domain
VTWFNRGTLHLVRSEDYAWLHAVTTPPHRTISARRLRQFGVSEAAAERGVRLMQKSLADEGPLTSAELRDRLSAGRVPAAGQAFGHLAFHASQRGLIVRGPMSGRQHRYVLVHDWLGPQPPVDRDVALADLARRYLAGHGPADDRDLARWAGLPLRDMRSALNAIASELRQRPDGLVELMRQPPPADIPPPRLLGAFDPVLLGWVSREQLLDVEQKIVTVGGMFYPFALVRGRAAALWTVRDGEVAIEPFHRITKKDMAALEGDAGAVMRFLAS